MELYEKGEGNFRGLVCWISNEEWNEIFNVSNLGEEGKYCNFVFELSDIVES